MKSTVSKDSNMLIFILLCVLTLHSEAFIFDGITEKWDSLRVKFGLNPFDRTAMEKMPRNVTEAESKGFVKNASCSDPNPFAGNRYLKDNDTSVMLLYDANGYIAGIQAGIPKSLQNYPSQYIRPPWIDDGNQYVLTAYFVNPDNICSSGRTAAQFESEGTGTNLYLQNGTNPIQDSLLIPKLQSDIENTKWTKGKCFWAMGLHYWYDLRKDMSRDEIQPFFLLYNGGKLNAFGWAFMADLKSTHYEHPPPSSFRLFMDPPPDCLQTNVTVSTMHIYMTDHPRLQNWC